MATGRPPGQGERFVRFDPPGPGRSGQLHISAACWHAIGRPARLDVQRWACRLGRLVILPASGDAGWAVTQSPKGGTPRLHIGAANAEALGLAEGRWAAEVCDGRIIIEE